MLIGGASAIKAMVSVARVKIFATLLGPTGVGVIGVYDSIVGMASTLAGLGIGSSGVRQISAASSSHDSAKLSRTILALRRVVYATGALGALGLVLLREPVSQITFGDSSHSGQVASLSIAVFFTCVTAGQIAIVQGLRRIRDVALISIIGPLLGTIICVPPLIVLREQAVVAVMIATAFGAVLSSWWYSRSITTSSTTISIADLSSELSGLLKLGIVFMLTAFLKTATAYAIKTLIVRKLGLLSSGLYQAAWVLASFHIDFILAAISKDFYPRLVSANSDRTVGNQMTNEQAEISLVIATPLIFGSIAFSPLVISIFYTSEFRDAASILQWQAIGVLLRVFAWPLAFIMLSNNRSMLYFFSELFVSSIQFLLTWVGISLFGLPGAGVAFLIVNAVHLVVLLFIAHYTNGFSFSKANRLLAFAAAMLTLFLFAIRHMLHGMPELITQGAIVSLSAVGSVYYIAKVAKVDVMGTILKRFRGKQR